MQDFFFDEFAFTYLGLAFFFALMLGVWIGWGIQSHRAQRAVQEKLDAQLLAARAITEARNNQEQQQSLKRSTDELTRAVREIVKRLEFDPPGEVILRATQWPMSQADGFES